MKAVNYLERQSKPVLVTLAVVLVGLLGALDWLTGPEISFSIFFLIPICFSVWFTGRPAGIAVSLLSALTWLAVDLLWGRQYTHPFIPYWNATVRLGFFLVIACQLSGLRALQETLEEKVEERTAALGTENTERRRTEEQLRASEQRFRQLTENIREVFWMTDLAKTKMIYISPGYETIWGRSCESVYRAPNSWLEAIHPQDRNRVLAAAMTEQVSGQYDQEYQIVRPDGSARWIRDRAFPVRDAAGNVYRIAGIAEDITERKLAEAQVATLAHAVETTSEMICITDLRDHFIFVNRAFQKTHGYTEGEILGKTPEILYSSRNPPSLLAEVLEQTRLGGWRGEVLDRRKDGTEFPIFLSTSLVKDRTGRVIGLMGVAQDITERKRVEQALVQAEEKYRGIFDGAQEGIFQTTADGRVLTANPALARMLGYDSREELIASVTDMALEVYVQSERRSEFKQLMEQRGAVRGFEVECNCKDGRRIWTSTDAHVVRDARGAVLYYEGIAQDITERKRLQREILEIADHEQQRIGQDLHDSLCQHLTATMFATKILEDDLARKSLPEAAQAREIVGFVHKAIDHARSIARGLDPIKVTADGLVASLQELAYTVRNLFRIDCVFQPGAPVVIDDHATAVHLYRIAQEAVNNAIKHAKPTQMEIGLTVMGNKTILTIKDNGAGLPERIDNRAGMGLHTMKSRAQIIGASIEVRPNRNGGTVVICSVQGNSTAPTNIQAVEGSG